MTVDKMLAGVAGLDEALRSIHKRLAALEGGPVYFTGRAAGDISAGGSGPIDRPDRPNRPAARAVNVTGTDLRAGQRVDVRMERADGRPPVYSIYGCDLCDRCRPADEAPPGPPPPTTAERRAAVDAGVARDLPDLLPAWHGAYGTARVNSAQLRGLVLDHGLDGLRGDAAKPGRLLGRRLAGLAEAGTPVAGYVVRRHGARGSVLWSVRPADGADGGAG